MSAAATLTTPIDDGMFAIYLCTIKVETVLLWIGSSPAGLVAQGVLGLSSGTVERDKNCLV